MPPDTPTAADLAAAEALLERIVPWLAQTAPTYCDALTSARAALARARVEGYREGWDKCRDGIVDYLEALDDEPDRR